METLEQNPDPGIFLSQMLATALFAFEIAGLPGDSYLHPAEYSLQNFVGFRPRQEQHKLMTGMN